VSFIVLRHRRELGGAERGAVRDHPRRDDAVHVDDGRTGRARVHRAAGPRRDAGDLVAFDEHLPVDCLIRREDGADEKEAIGCACDDTGVGRCAALSGEPLFPPPRPQPVTSAKIAATTQSERVGEPGIASSHYVSQVLVLSTCRLSLR